MVGILLIAHQPLASALAQSVAHVYSASPAVEAPRVSALDVVPDADVNAMVERARELIAEIDHGGGVLVLTDAFGATPGNVASRLAEPGRVSVIAGVNLPMLLRAVCYRSGALPDLVEKALAGGTQGVMEIGSTAVQNQGFRPVGNDYARLHHQQ
jgi:mannose PTS system EIIA component